MSVFKKGDKVVCVNPECSDGYLNRGSLYQVRDVKGGYIELYIPGCSTRWAPHRFELIEDQPKQQSENNYKIIVERKDGVTTISTTDGVTKEHVKLVKDLLDLLVEGRR